MTAGPDELEQLLGDIRKTISDNRQFLKNLLDDADAAPGAEAEPGESAGADEEFEEL